LSAYFCFIFIYYYFWITSSISNW